MNTLILCSRSILRIKRIHRKINLAVVCISTLFCRLHGHLNTFPLFSCSVYIDEPLVSFCLQNLVEELSPTSRSQVRIARVLEFVKFLHFYIRLPDDCFFTGVQGQFDIESIVHAGASFERIEA